MIPSSAISLAAWIRSVGAVSKVLRQPDRIGNPIVGSCWDFLTRDDSNEVSLALAWERDAHAEIFPKADVVWLEAGFQEANFKQRYREHVDEAPESFARSVSPRRKS
jgi:hypothetical protein